MWTLYVSPRECRYCKHAAALLDATNQKYKVVQQDTPPFGNSWPQLTDSEGRRVNGFDKLRDRLDEPILSASMSRFSPIPVKHFDIWHMYKTAQAVNWVSEEVDFSLDLEDWKALDPTKQHFLKRVLAFFNGADGIVQENLMMNFVLEVQYPEARQFYAHQAYIESVHAETYGTLLSTYITDECERDELLNAIQTAPSVQAKAAWAMKWMDSDRPFAERLVAFICVEGIMFSGSFCAIFWMKQRGKLPSLTFSNDFIARDEGMHQRFGELLYTRHLKHKLPQTTVHDIIAEAVEAEVQFVQESVPDDMRDPHLDAPRVVEYVKYVADRIAIVLGYSPLFRAKQPFPWMESISLRGINNFFEKRSEVYQDSMVGKSERPVFNQEDTDF